LRTLLARTICPHCWVPFSPEDVLFISAHADLVGDPRLGAERQQRFRPTRFDLAGNALDARGLPCNALACPRCHLPVPHALLETEPAFVSILGTVACGKSFFLATLTWALRQVLTRHFALTFTDADPAANRLLSDYEEQLFLHPAPDTPVPVGDLIHKTLTQGDGYDTVRYGSQEVSYPRPFLFSVRPQRRHPNGAAAAQFSRLLCLYDNAGESFQPGAETTRSPVTQHLAHSRLLLFLFDPTQDARFRKLCRPAGGRAAAWGGPTSRQETVLLEAAARVRRATGLSQNARHKRPLIVVLTKHDAWSGLLGERTPAEPWAQSNNLAALDVGGIEHRSRQARDLLQHTCPEIVTAAEEFAREVVYVPVSALGRPPELDPHSGKPVIRPKDIRPFWAAVPLLYGLCRFLPGLVPALERQARRSGIKVAERPERPRFQANRG
jgi:hypothetical protein